MVHQPVRMVQATLALADPVGRIVAGNHLVVVALAASAALALAATLGTVRCFVAVLDSLVAVGIDLANPAAGIDLANHTAASRIAAVVDSRTSAAVAAASRIGHFVASFAQAVERCPFYGTDHRYR